MKHVAVLTVLAELFPCTAATVAGATTLQSKSGTNAIVLSWAAPAGNNYLEESVKRALVYITHDQEEVMAFCDEVVVMMRGRIVARGGASEPSWL